MKRLKKTILLQVRKAAHLSSQWRLYYWAEWQLFELRTVCILPGWYYKGLYRVCMWLLKYRRFHGVADRTIHTIPYTVRFRLA